MVKTFKAFVYQKELWYSSSFLHDTTIKKMVYIETFVGNNNNKHKETMITGKESSSLQT